MDASRLLRAARGRAGLSQRALAKRARVPQPMIAMIESGRQDPRLGTLSRLLEACAHDVDLVPRAGVGVDRSQFRATLRMSPAARLRRATEGARALRALRSSKRVG